MMRIPPKQIIFFVFAIASLCCAQMVLKGPANVKLTMDEDSIVNRAFLVYDNSLPKSEPAIQEEKTSLEQENKSVEAEVSDIEYWQKRNTRAAEIAEKAGCTSATVVAMGLFLSAGQLLFNPNSLSLTNPSIPCW